MLTSEQNERLDAQLSKQEQEQDLEFAAQSHDPELEFVLNQMDRIADDAFRFMGETS